MGEKRRRFLVEDPKVRNILKVVKNLRAKKSKIFLKITLHRLLIHRSLTHLVGAAPRVL